MVLNGGSAAVQNAGESKSFLRAEDFDRMKDGVEQRNGTSTAANGPNLIRPAASSRHRSRWHNRP